MCKRRQTPAGFHLYLCFSPAKSYGRLSSLEAFPGPQTEAETAVERDVRGPRQSGRQVLRRLQDERDPDQGNRYPVAVQGVVNRHRPRVQVAARQPARHSEEERDVREERKDHQRPPARVIGDDYRDRKSRSDNAQRRVAELFHGNAGTGAGSSAGADLAAAGRSRCSFRSWSGPRSAHSLPRMAIASSLEIARPRPTPPAAADREGSAR